MILRVKSKVAEVGLAGVHTKRSRMHIWIAKKRCPDSELHQRLKKHIEAASELKFFKRGQGRAYGLLTILWPILDK